MMILALVRNYIPSYQWVVDGGWNIADCGVALLRPRGHAGRHRRGRPHRLGRAAPPETVQKVLQYTDRHRLPAEVEEGAGRHLPPLRRVAGSEACDVVTINAPLHPGDREPVRRRCRGWGAWS